MSWDESTKLQGPPSAIGKTLPERDQAFLVVLAGGAMGEMFKLTREKTVVGRGPRADVRLMDDGISREHCELLVDSGHFVLRDLGSTNGTFCRGRKVDQDPVKLEDGDKILVGTGTVLKFTFHDKLDETFQRQMYESALRDDLTKAFNKKYFLDRLESEFAYSSRHAMPLALVTFDIDHFKNINDTWGHPAGDQVLRDLATTVEATIRVEDVFARTGGEEFTVICRGADIHQGMIVGERLRASIERRQFLWDGKVLPVTISAGVAAVPAASIRDAMEFIAASDQVLYEAKRGGRNRVAMWRG